MRADGGGELLKHRDRAQRAEQPARAGRIADRLVDAVSLGRVHVALHLVERAGQDRDHTQNPRRPAPRPGCLPHGNSRRSAPAAGRSCGCRSLRSWPRPHGRCHTARPRRSYPPRRPGRSSAPRPTRGPAADVGNFDAADLVAFVFHRGNASFDPHCTTQNMCRTAKKLRCWPKPAHFLRSRPAKPPEKNAPDCSGACSDIVAKRQAINSS